MFDDIGYYFEHHSNQLNINEQPSSATFFLKRIIALNLSMLLEYRRSHFDHLERGFLDLRESESKTRIKWQESRWNALHLFSRQVKFDADRILSIKLQLRDINEDDDDGNNNNKATVADFEHLAGRCKELRAKIDSLVTSATSVSSIIDAKRSLDEAASVFWLIVLGVVFLPLSFTSGLFSMDADFQPGSSKFWIYWVVSLCLISAILLPMTLFWYLDKRSVNDRNIERPWRFVAKP